MKTTIKQFTFIIASLALMPVSETAKAQANLAQHHRICGTMDYLAAQMQEDPGLELRMQNIERELQQWIASNANQRTTDVVTIPVVVHVVYNTPEQNISDVQILEQINVLNQDFSRTNADAVNTPSVWQSIAANTMIQFCLAQSDPDGNATNGIVRVPTTVTSFSNHSIKFTSSGGDDAWPPWGYLNIWVGNLSGGLLGFATFPGGSELYDGIVVDYATVGGPAAPGTYIPYHLGRTATHEAGHWLNLYHIWGDDNNCSGSDLVDDTPNQRDENIGCPVFPSVSCSNGPSGDMFMNYMDYTDDACMNMFTAGQALRTSATINGAHSDLQTSPGCVPPSGPGCGLPSGLNATSITQTSATLNWTAVSGAVSYNVQYKVVGPTTWTTTTSATNSVAVSALTPGTKYRYQVQAVCSDSTSSYLSFSQWFTTLSSSACPDNYEPNGSISAAVTVATDITINGKISPSGDNDYYRFTTTSPNTNIKIMLTNLPANYNLKLYNSSGTLLSTSQNSGTTSETIIRNATVAATYYAHVYGQGNANNSTVCYNLLIQTGSVPFRNIPGFEVEAEDAEIMNVFPNPAQEKLTINFYASVEGLFTFKLFDMIGINVMNTFHYGVKGMNTFELNLSELNKGMYFVEVVTEKGRVVKKIVKL